VQRDPLVFLDDIIEACGKIDLYIVGMTLDQFQRDQKDKGDAGSCRS
jgi:uncharacterized protein with HEPN domain